MKNKLSEKQKKLLQLVSKLAVISIEIVEVLNKSVGKIDESLQQIKALHKKVYKESLKQNPDAERVMLLFSQMEKISSHAKRNSNTIAERFNSGAP